MLDEKKEKEIEPRSLIDVLRKILSVIPKEYEFYKEIESGFNCAIESAQYKAPELMWECWAIAANALEKYLPIDIDFGEQAAKIFNNKEDSNG